MNTYIYTHIYIYIYINKYVYMYIYILIGTAAHLFILRERSLRQRCFGIPIQNRVEGGFRVNPG